MGRRDHVLTPAISVIIPTLDEAGELPAALESCVTRNLPQELLVVDGGSRDATRELADLFFREHEVAASRFIDSASGRARQMNAGAKVAHGDVLLFLHADTRLPEHGLDAIRAAIRRGAVWGRFDVQLSGANRLYRLIEWLMNWRSRLTGVTTGDQAMFVRRDAYHIIGGFAPLPLMEDIDLARRLKIFGQPESLRERVVTSSRRWEQGGIARTLLRMWILRFLFFVGVSPARLWKWY